MEILKLKQGLPEWHAERRACDGTASEAPVMMGVSTKMKRDELLAMKKFGNEKEISDYVQKFLFDKGHEYEAKARPIAEKEIGDDLYPVTGKKTIDGLVLLASYDGLTMMRDIAWEHKMFNESLAQSVRAKSLDPEYYWQLEQQLLISGAEKVKFTVSDGTEANKESMWYYPRRGRAEKLIAGWKQFKKDLETYELLEVVAPEAKSIESLPSLQIMVTGAITNSNLDVYHKSAITFIDSINTDLQTDEDFANAEKTGKFLKNAEIELQNVKKQIFSQTADIEKAVNTIDHIFESSRVKRLSLEKLVKSQKEVRKAEIVNAAKLNFDQHMEALLSELNGQTFTVVCDFVGAIKGKRTIESLHNAVNTELAQRKIEANEIAGLIRGNLNTYKEMASNFEFLFNDLSGFIQKQPDDFKLLVESRINQHEQAEKEKREREREQIRIEEERKAQEKVDAENERKRIEAENEAIAEQRRIKAEEKLKAEQERINAETEKAALEEIEQPPKAEEPITEHKDEQADVGNEPVCIPRTDFAIPGSGEIINVLARHYGVTNDDVLGWLQGIDFRQLAKAS